MNLTVILDGKEIIPVRAIPFVTGWLISPDLVAKTLANTDHWTTRLKALTSYHHMDGGKYAPMLPKEWDCIEAELETLAVKLKSVETAEQENYAKWRKESIPLLPANCFVWKDEFENAFAESYSSDKLILTNERHGDRKLNFLAYVPSDLLNSVMEGFTASENEPSENISDPEAMRRRELQIEIILAIIEALEFEPIKIPDGGKARIKTICLSRPRLFTPSSFDRAWQAGLSQDKFRLANHQKYSPNN
jgi:hypothetical protein